MYRMRIYNIAILTCVVLLIGGCGENARPLYEGNIRISFDVPVGEINPLLRGTFSVPGIPTFYNQNNSINGITEMDVKSITAGRGVLRARFQDINLGFLEDISVQISSRSQPNDAREIFFLNDFRLNEGFSTELFAQPREIKDLFNQDGLIDIQVILEYRNLVAVPFAAEIDFTYAVYTE